MDAAKKFEISMLGLVTSVAIPELQDRARQYESGEKELVKSEIIRDLKAAVNAAAMLNEAMLELMKES